MSSRTQQVLKETTIYGLGGAGSKFISFLLFPLYSRVFNVDDYGAIEVINTFVLLISILLTSGTDMAQSYFFFEYKHQEERKRTLSTLSFYIFIINLFLTILVCIFSRQISSVLLGTDQYSNLLQIASLAIPWMGLYTFNLNLLRLQRKPTVYISITLPFVLFQIVANIMLVLVFHTGLPGIFLTNIASYALFTIISIIVNHTHWEFHFDIPRFKEMFQYWSPLLPVGISAWFLASADRLFLSSFSTLEATGIYSAGLRIASIIGFLVQAFRTANLPFIFEVSKDADAKTVYQKTLSYYLYFISFVAVAVSLCAYPLILLFSGEAYLPALQIIPPLAFVYVLSGVSQIVSIGAMISKNTKYVGIITTLSAVLMAILMWICIPRYGAIGTAYATLFANLIYNLLLYNNSQKSYPIPYEKGRIARIILVSVLLILLKSQLQIDSLGVDVLVSIGFCLLFVLLTPLFSLLTTNEIKALRKQIQLFIKQIFAGKKKNEKAISDS